MIEIVLSNGDRAEADDPESAVLATRTMMDEAERAGSASSSLCATFLVGGCVVVADVRRANLSGSLR